MKRGFTLIELLGIIVVLGIIATIVTPVIQSTLAQNQESVYNTLVKQIEGNAKDYLEYNTDKLPQDEGDSVVVKLGEMKEAGFIQISIKNPKTDNIISNESYVTVTKKGNNYTFETTIHDLTDADEVVSGAPTIILAGSSNETIASGSNYNLEKIDNVSRQIIFNGKEVSSIDTSAKGVYEVYYSKLENGKLGITIKTVKVN
jgi:type II secretory pathway pseudopilin PulG